MAKILLVISPGPTKPETVVIIIISASKLSIMNNLCFHDLLDEQDYRIRK